MLRKKKHLNAGKKRQEMPTTECQKIECGLEQILEVIICLLVSQFSRLLANNLTSDAVFNMAHSKQKENQVEVCKTIQNI